MRILLVESAFPRHASYVREEGPEKASGATTQAGDEVVQDDLRDMGCGATVSGNLFSCVEAA